MFNSLSGIITGKFPQKLFIDTHGIEWDVTVPDSSLDKLPDIGSEGRVFVWMQQKCRRKKWLLYLRYQAGWLY